MLVVRPRQLVNVDPLDWIQVHKHTEETLTDWQCPLDSSTEAQPASSCLGSLCPEQWSSGAADLSKQQELKDPERIMMKCPARSERICKILLRKDEPLELRRLTNATRASHYRSIYIHIKTGTNCCNQTMSVFYYIYIYMSQGSCVWKYP